MRDSAAPTEYKRSEVELLLNGRPSRVGNSIEPRLGSRRTHENPINGDKRGWGAVEFANEARDLAIIAAVGDKWFLSDDSGQNWAAVPGAVNLDEAPWSFVRMRLAGAKGTPVNAVIGANGDKPLLYNGEGSVAELSQWPDGTKYMAVFNDRLYGTDGSILVYGSAVADPGELRSGPGGLVVRCQSHDDDPEVTGLWAHGVVLLVFKRRSMGYIEGFGYQTIQVQTGERGLSRSVGCIAYRSIAPAGDGGVCWLSDRGIEYLAPGSLAPQLVSSPIQRFMDSLSWDRIRTETALPVAMWWQSKEEYWLSVPAGGANLNTHVIVFRPPARGRPAALWLHQEAQEDAKTLYVDNQGTLTMANDGSQQRLRLRRGVVQLDNLVGSYVSTDFVGSLEEAEAVAANPDVDETDHTLAELVPQGSIASIFPADIDDVTDVEVLKDKPHMIGYDGIVRHMEVGDKDDVLKDGTGGKKILARVRSRPFVYGDVTRNKAPTSVRVSALPESDVAEVNIRLLGDGRQLQQRVARIERKAAQRPRPDRIRMGGGKATAVQVELEIEGLVTVQAIEATVRHLDETP